ncbi:hypothetical protein FNV43_RR03336 [Rhamnella rubrinervis]|uniref:Pentatricopeptide repeat-containing protein n=1 Tax=Rhamnella rubrinervis TaxID=2594499 RepID=A0A8K0MP75_9ROSA|nr:hypothetical protein FNV43_RR03336 [Rhamnella rubrinervis]
MNCVQLKHLSSAIRSISTHRHVSKTTFNLSHLETPSYKCRDFKEFKQIVSQMILTGSIKDTFAAKRLLQFSTRDSPFIHLDYSYQIFNVIENPDASIYNIMMTAYIQRNYPHRAIPFYKLMLYRNVGPNVYTYPFLVEACTIRDSKFEGKQLHNHVLKLGFDSDPDVRSIFVDMYADCYMCDDAIKFFYEGPTMGSFVWYSLLEGCRAHGDQMGTEYFYNLMPKKDTTASNFMIVCFKSWGKYKKVAQLINEMPENDTVSWTGLINCFQARYREMYEEAFDVFIAMHANGTTIDELVMEAVLRCCTKFASLGDIVIGILIHCLVVKMGIECDVELQNSLIRMYSACEGAYSSKEEVASSICSIKKLFNAACWLHQDSWTAMLNKYVEYVKYGFDGNVEALFESMPNKDEESWIVMINYYSRHVCFFESLTLFQEMVRSGISLDDYTMFRIIIALPYRFEALDLGKCIHAYIIKNGCCCLNGSRLGAKVSSMYTRCGYKVRDDERKT